LSIPAAAGVPQAAGAALGYDLDNVCSCLGGGRSCTPRAPSAVEHCDQPGGRDIEGNSFFGELFELALNGTNLGDIDHRIDAGSLGYFVQVRHYSGGPDSTGLFVGFYNLSILPEIDASTGEFHARSPWWDGGDVWAVDCALSAAGGCKDDTPVLDQSALLPGFFDPQAYVSGNILVAHASPVVIGIGLTTLRLTDVVITATITPMPDGSGYRLDNGQIAGRFPTRDIFVMLASMKEATGPGYLCGDSVDLQQLKTKICAEADLTELPSDDAGAPCDALSMVIPFTALPAQVGYRFDRKPPTRGCDGAPTTDCTE
jgi:hypothetical protein